MLSTKVISLITFLVVIVAVVLSVTSAPVAAPVSADQANKNQTLLQSDSIPVSSTGKTLTVYDTNDAKKINSTIVDKGNSAKGKGEGL
ncbi:hypothetical protein RclHR1_06180007 [Rhizophagus clarus]|uniref:Uncharacterized protein n=1 Tax=Rhizophagus clarus TaxID=94130 RepID=A0A2Z6S8Z6_9GLOM|nr:hypothetical protein RclHR1_06180007 [Rhizophagus clarus]GES87894.1 hypothetical protein GLOIN_2v1772693 [Rhizophagus clarus]